MLQYRHSNRLRTGLALVTILGVLATMSCRGHRQVASSHPQRSLLEIGLEQLRMLPPDQTACCAPYSLTQALAATALGARGETRRELDLLSAYAIPPSSDPRTRFQSENSLWVDTGLKLSSTYLNTARARFGVQAANLPLLAQPERAAHEINSWVAEKTGGRIDRLLGPPDLQNALMVLTNAVLFHGEWKWAFDSTHTRPRPFHAPGGEVELPMMRLTSVSIPYARGHIGEVVVLPYSDTSYRMTLLLPPEKQDHKRLLETRVEEILALAHQAKPRGEMEVILPRFKTRSHLNPIPMLQNMGIRQAFTPRADFHDLTGTDNGLHIARIIHAAEVEVNERSTEASAATAVIMTRGVIQTHRVCFDRPFLFIISHGDPKNALFIGRFCGEKTH